MPKSTYLGPSSADQVSVSQAVRNKQRADEYARRRLIVGRDRACERLAQAVLEVQNEHMFDAADLVDQVAGILRDLINTQMVMGAMRAPRLITNGENKKC